jgi:hypothetical protein
LEADAAFGAAIAELSRGQTLIIASRTNLGGIGDRVISASGITIRCEPRSALSSTPGNQRGLRLQFTGNNQTFTGCTLNGPGSAVTGGEQAVVVSGNHFTATGNRITGFGSSGGSGILEIISGSHDVIAHNTIIRNKDFGVFINATSASTSLTDFHVAKNEVGNGIVFHAMAAGKAISQVVISTNNLCTGENGRVEFCVEAGV